MEVDAVPYVLPGDDVFTFEQSGLAHPGLGREVHEVRALEAGHVFPGVFQQRLHAAPAFELGRGQVCHLHCVEAGHVRAVAPHDAGKRGLEPPVLPASADEAFRPAVDRGESLRLLELEALRSVRIHPTDA